MTDLQTRFATLLMLVVLSLLGCSYATQEDEPTAPSHAPALHTELPPTAPETESETIVLTPTPELVDATFDAITRWSAAIGADLVIGFRGIPVRYTLAGESLPTEMDACYCAPGGVLIDPSAVDESALPDVVAHEIGHLLSGKSTHTDSGLMAPKYSGPTCITPQDLEYVCNNFACERFQPECAS